MYEYDVVDFIPHFMKTRRKSPPPCDHILGIPNLDGTECNCKKSPSNRCDRMVWQRLASFQATNRDRLRIWSLPRDSWPFAVDRFRFAAFRQSIEHLNMPVGPHQLNE